MKKEINTRNDVEAIVSSFYAKVRVDETLGPIFNRVITDWDLHLEHLTNFWNMNLFGVKDYSGDPISAHQHVDEQTPGGITPYHFGTWLNLWFETIDASYEGDIADIMKRRARKMQTPLMISIFEHRNKTKENPAK